MSTVGWIVFGFVVLAIGVCAYAVYLDYRYDPNNRKDGGER